MLWGGAGGNKSTGELKPGPMAWPLTSHSHSKPRISHPTHCKSAILILFCVPQLERSSGKKHQVPKTTEHPRVPWAPTQHLLPGRGWSVPQGYTQEPPLCNSGVTTQLLSLQGTFHPNNFHTRNYWAFLDEQSDETLVVTALRIPEEYLRRD